MFNEKLPHNDVAIRILKAADKLMATHGVQHLSTHKIAREAGVSVGTIYLYFKDKDELLNQLVLSLFGDFADYVEQHFLPELSLFEQYQKLWRATWDFMQSNPNVVQNMHQYEALPGFREVMLTCHESESLVWNKLFKSGQAQGVISPLPIYILAAMSLKAAWELMYVQLLRDEQFDEVLIEEVIFRTWKAITI